MKIITANDIIAQKNHDFYSGKFYRGMTAKQSLLECQTKFLYCSQYQVLKVVIYDELIYVWHVSGKIDTEK